MTIRTRFAPSPTGFQHVGNIRTALFAYLVARHGNGTFILRLEDTDKNREVEGAANHLVKTLQTLNIEWDEGFQKGGPHAPYIQSERLAIYRRWAQKLIDAGRAYADPYTPEQVQAFREQAQAIKQPFLYRNHRPEDPPAWDGTMPLRFKSEPRAYTWHDAVMGTLSTGPEVIDDFILFKSDGFPTYNFCHIVDDAEMAVTHIIRGQEFISSMPNYLNLYEALGYDMAQAPNLKTDAQNDSTTVASGGEAPLVNLLREQAEGVAPLPVFAHMPHILNEQGNKQLGKRDGAKDILDYIREGFLPETMMSFIATLGWNDGTEQEVFTKDELIAKFSLDRVQRSGARFDEKRLLWMNGQFIRGLDSDDLYARVETFWPDSAKNADPTCQKSVLMLVQDRLKTLADLPLLTDYFFTEPRENWALVTENKQLKKLERSEITSIIQTTHDSLATLTDWTPETLQARLNDLLATTGHKPAILFGLIRVVTTWAPFSPQLHDTLALLGREQTLSRLNAALASSHAQ